MISIIELVKERRAHFIALFCSSEPPIDLCIDGEYVSELHDWITDNLKTEFKYASSDAILNAAFDTSILGINDHGLFQ